MCANVGIVWYLYTFFLVLIMTHAACAQPFAAYQQLHVAPHLHSRYSDGAHRISEVTAMARDAGYDAVWMSDHADMYLQYPVLGTTIGYRLNSLREKGFGKYLHACAVVQERNPEMLILPGFEASPYYYWSGDVFGKKLINHQWMKHLLVIGIEDEKVFRRLPMMAYKSSAYRPGRKDHGEAPYRDFVRAVNEAGGMAFWAHPQLRVNKRLWGNIHAQVEPYSGSLLTVPVSAGVAVTEVEDAITEPGGIWDQAIAAYCSGERPSPPRPMVEIDYHRGEFPATRTLTILLPEIAEDAAAKKTACIEALRAGRYYVTNAPPGEKRLEDFTANSGDAPPAILGETLTSQGPATLSYSLVAESTVEWVHLIRNGAVVHTGTELCARWTDQDMPPAGATWSYRLAARFADQQFLLTNPIYFHSNSEEIERPR